MVKVIPTNANVWMLTNKIYKWLFQLLPLATEAVIISLILKLNVMEFSCFNEKADPTGK